MEHKSVVGFLTFVPHGENGPEHYFELESGEFLQLKFSGGVNDASTVPCNEKIALCMSVVNVDGVRLVCSHKPFFTVLESHAGLMANASLVKKHIGIFQQAPPSTSDPDMAELQATTEEMARQVEDYFRRYGRKYWDVQVRGYAMKGEENTRPPTYARNDIDKFMTEHDMDGFNPNYFHVYGGRHTSYCGQGNLPGNRSATYFVRGSICGVKTMIHELGHNFGLWHSSTLEGDELREYGDTSSIMGSVRVVTGLNSPIIKNLKILESRELLSTYDTQQVLICPLEMSEHGMHENEWQHIQINKDGPIHVSLRKVKGAFYAGADKSHPETLYVHKAPSYSQAVRLLPDLMPGETKQVSENVKIEYLEYKNETARVNIYTKATDPTPEDLVISEGFPSVMATEVPSSIHNGLWYNKDFNGEGFDIHIKDGMFVLYWYTYNQDNTSRRFYYGTCPIEGNVMEFELFTTKDGTWEDPTEHEVVSAGNVQMYFLDSENAVFNFNTEEHGRGSVEVTPVVISEGNPSSGVYYQPSRNGEGFSIQFLDQLNSCMAYWYSYGPKYEPVNGYPRAGTEQRWYMCQGTKQPDGTYDMDVYEALGNTWMELRYDPNVFPVGTAKLTVIDEDDITFEYDIDAEVEGSGTYNLERLF